MLRLRGKGLPGAGEAPAGDLFVTLRIALPAGEDKALADLMREWRDQEALRSAPGHERLTGQEHEASGGAGGVDGT